jgi:hypothetical protein
MKRSITLLLVAVISVLPAFAQTYTMSNTTVTTCGGTFYDSGGNSFNYGNNEYLTMTFTSSTGDRLSMAFSAFNVESCCDRLYIYDGPTASYPLIGTYTSNPGTIVSTGSSLTFRFTSDGSQTYFGWVATLSCTTPALTAYPITAGSVTACSGAFYDNGGATANYSDNLNITETFCSGTSDFLQFTFWSNATNIASGDTLFVYDGGTSAAPLLGAYTYGSTIESFTSSGSCLTFVFKSNASGNNTGWAGWFQCTSTPASPGVYNMSSGIRGTCGGGFYDSGGTTWNYSDNEYKTMTFVSTNGNRIDAAFSSFTVETCCDRLYIYDGPSASYPLIGVYTTNPGTISSTGTSLTFVFSSDGSGNYAGWAATINCTTPVLPVYNLTSGTVTACSGAFYDNGGPAANYSDNLNTIETFCSGTSDYLQFSFLNNATNIASGDTLFVYDGSTISAPLIAAFTLGSNLETFTSSGTCITFRFKSNASGNNTGWAGQFRCTTTPPSSGVYNMSSGIRGTCGAGFYDSGGSAGNYGNNENRSMTFMSTNGNRLDVTFSSFSVETCCERLYVYDGPSPAYPLIGIYTTNPGTISSTGTSLTFVFTSDGGNTYAGWAATVSCTTPALTVYPLTAGTITVCSGVVCDNGGQAGNYSDNLNTVETFCSGTSDHLQFTFWTNATNLATGDSLFVYDGSSTSSPLLATYVIGSTLESFISSGTCITFRFKSNASGNNTGWAGWFNCTATAPSPGSFSMSTGVRYICAGSFYDSGGSGGNYGNSENHSQTFTSYNGDRISFTFSAFNVETCCDRLYIYDGPSTAYPLLGTYISNPGTVISSGSSLTFVFTSDASTSYSGWAATATCAGPVLTNYTMSTGTFVTCQGVFYDNGGPTVNYPNNENRVTTFTSGTGQYLKFDFNPNHFNIATGDSLFIYDGTSTSSPLFAILTGSTAPGSLTSNTSSFTFRFKSDASTNASGWQAWISCVSAPDNNPVINMSGGVRYTCGGTFYDAGGAAGNYPNSEYRSMTFFSNSGCGIRFQFTSFNTESCCDMLYVYDGPSTASTLIGTYAGSSLPPLIQSTGSALTFRFASDGSTSYSGWSATISCPNQPLATVTASGPTTICSGDSVTLTAAPNTSYLWNTGATTQSIVVHNNGSYWVSVANASGCTAVSSITTVTVNPVPAPVISAGGPTTFCAGGNVVLTASGGNTYLWSNNSTSTSITVSNSGNFSVTATAANGCSATSAPVAVTVNPLPPVNAAATSSTICSGNSTTITATGASTYSWMPGSLTGSSITVSPSSATTYTVTGTSAAGCTNTATLLIIVNPTPTLTVSASNATICNGSSATLSVTGASAYSWMPGSLSGSSITVSPSSTTTYTVTETSSGCSASATQQITVNPTPTVTASASLSTICAGGSTTLTASGANSYTWMPGSLTGSSVTVSPVSSTTYTITGTGANGCTDVSTIAVTVNALPSVSISASGTTVCNGDPVTLTASGATSYSWMPGSMSGNTVSVSPASYTTYTVTGTNANGCTNTETITISVGVTPTITATASSPAICDGSSTTLSASGGSTYLWMPGSFTGSFVAVSPNTTTTYTVTGTSASGCSSTTTTTVTVNPTPSPVISASGPLIFCQGDSVVLSVSGGGTYLWTNGSTNSSIVVNVSGSYGVTETNSFGCSAAASPVTVGVNSIPVATISASGPTSFCQGDNVVLTASGGSTYLWNNSSSSPAITVTAAGTYFVIASNGTCSDTSAAVTVSVNPLPTVALALPQDTFCVNGVPSTLSGGSPAGGIYSGPGVSSGSLDPAVAGQGTHTITYTWTDANGCSNSATQSVYVDICNGTAGTEEAGFSVMPNPVKDELKVTLGNGETISMIRLYDMTGRLLLEEESSGKSQLVVPVSSFAPGVYLLEVSGKTQHTIRIVKE